MAGYFEYDKEFYQMQSVGSYESARAITDYFVRDIMTVASVLDVGCGVGTWLKAWGENGAEISGIDGQEINDDSLLYVPRDKIKIADLDTIKKTDDKKYDLCMTLEVAEHLRPENSENFVNFLTQNSDLILFSAGIPHQIGHNHINCRPLQFWVDEFAKHGFECFDIIRPYILANADAMSDVRPSYIQNSLIFAKGDKKAALIKRGYHTTSTPIMIYHRFFATAMRKDARREMREQPFLKRLLQLFK